MEWRENPQLADFLLGEIDKDLELEKPMPHITELIYCLTKGYWDRTNRMPRAPKTTCMFAIGVGLGDVLLQRLRQEEAGECEGIHYSVDFLDWEGRLGELKTTRYAVKKPPHEWSTGWHRQLKSYMKVRNTLEAVYAVMFVIPAEFKVWEVTATREEVDQNWTWMQARRAIYMGHMSTDVPTFPTPFTYNEKWECSGCQYKLLCDAEAETMRVEDVQAGEAAEDAERSRAESNMAAAEQQVQLIQDRDMGSISENPEVEGAYDRQE